MKDPFTSAHQLEGQEKESSSGDIKGGEEWSKLPIPTI